MRVLLGALLVLACAASVTCARRTPNEGGVLRIAAASDLRFAADDLVQGFTATRPDLRVEVSFGSSGTIHAQIAAGAPYDLFLSADVAYAASLATAGRGHGDPVPYAVGRLALWVPIDATLAIESEGLRALSDPAARRIVYANPQHAPYGRAAVEALASVGLAQAVADRTVMAENVAQAAQFLTTGAADAGFIAVSLARTEPLRRAGRHIVVPASAHAPLMQAALVLSGGNVAGARAFVGFLVGASGRAILSRHGFEIP